MGVFINGVQQSSDRAPGGFIPVGQSAPLRDGKATPITVIRAFAAGQDSPIIAAGELGGPFQIIEATLDVDTTGGGNGTLRTATGGGGAAVSSAMAVTAAVRVESTLNAFPTVAVTEPVVLNKSVDTAAVGTARLSIIRL